MCFANHVRRVELSTTAFLPKNIDSDLTDIALDTEAMSWIPNGEGVWIKPLQFWASTGMWAQLNRYEPGLRTGRHVHAGGQVMAYVIQGSWHYLKHDWVARAGSWVWEPPGDLHTLEVLGDEQMIGLFIISGVVQYLDDDGQITRQTDFRSRRLQYREHCRALNIEPVVPMVG